MTPLDETVSGYCVCCGGHRRAYQLLANLIALVKAG